MTKFLSLNGQSVLNFVRTKEQLKFKKSFLQKTRNMILEILTNNKMLENNFINYFLQR